MSNGPLFDRLRLPASTSDPTTSWEAAERAIASGHVHEGVRRVVRGVVGFPGLTSAELAVELELDRYEAARRLADARRLGLAEQGTKRVCRVGRLKCVTWIATAAGRDLAGRA